MAWTLKANRYSDEDSMSETSSNARQYHKIPIKTNKMKTTATNLTNQITVTIPMPAGLFNYSDVKFPVQNYDQVVDAISNVNSIRELNDLCDSGIFQYI